MPNTITEYIAKFLDLSDIRNTGSGRYRSWNIVYEDFQKSTDVDYLAISKDYPPMKLIDMAGFQYGYLQRINSL